jgi:CRP-like cAMP-binding protein
MTEDEIKVFLKDIKARKIIFKKDQLIFSKLEDNDLMGIILFGSANIIKYDYNGNKIILNNLEYDAILGKPFVYYDNDINIIAASDCEILFIDYQSLIISNSYANIRNNIIDILVTSMSKINERVNILSKKTIREKLLSYFNMLSKKKKSKTFNLPITYIELADYLSVDRSAMMRELKKLKNEKIISSNEKKITILK